MESLACGIERAYAVNQIIPQRAPRGSLFDVEHCGQRLRLRAPHGGRRDGKYAAFVVFTPVSGDSDGNHAGAWGSRGDRRIRGQRH